MSRGGGGGIYVRDVTGTCGGGGGGGICPRTMYRTKLFLFLSQ